MNGLSFSPKAIEDLEGILDHIAEDNPTRATSFVSALKDQCRTIASYPGMGAKREHLARKLRVFPIGNYGIYYRPVENGVRIERVLHAARDVDSLFE